MLQTQFELPLIYQLIAVFLLAMTGAMLAIQKKYDFSGVLIMAFVAGSTGAIIRDGVLLNDVPMMLTQWKYLVAILFAALISPLIIDYIKKIIPFFVAVDALGLGIFGIISTQMALNTNLSVVSAIFVGLVVAVSGGLLRDVLTQNEPLLLKPGQYYFTAVLIGIIVFVLLTVYLLVDAQFAAIIGIIITFAIRMLSYKYGWHTAPASEIPKKIFKKS